MDSDFSPSGSGKTQGSTGDDAQGSAMLDHIKSVEKREQERFDVEKNAMDAEEQEVRDALKIKEEDAEQQFKDDAKQELKELKDGELSIILKQAEQDGASQIDALEADYEKNAPALVDKLVDEFMQLDFSTAA